MHANANKAVSEATENPEEAAARAALGHTLKRVGPFHPTTMQTLDSLANILQSQNKMEEAEHLRRQADRVSCAAAANLTTRHTLLPLVAHANSILSALHRHRRVLNGSLDQRLPSDNI